MNIFGGNTGLSYEDVQRRRRVADALVAQNANTPRNVGEGLSAIGRALAARAIEKRTDKRMGELNAEADKVWQGLFGGAPEASPGVSGVSVPPVVTMTEGQGIADDAMAAVGKRPMNKYRNAVASIESAGSGDYAAVGPTHPKLGRALGRYQIMEANIGPWSKEVLGREVTPDEFMQNPQIQDAIFDGKFGGYIDKYGEEGAAQAWIGGPGGVGEVGRRDSLGTSVGEYGQKFVSALGGQPSAQPASAAPGVQQIVTALSNPIIAQDPGKRAVLEALLQRAMAPQGGRYSVITGDQAASMGLDPKGAYNLGPDGRITQIGGGGTNVTVNSGSEVGSIPQGYELFTDPTTGARSLRPIPGGPADTTENDTAKTEQAQRAGGVVLEDIGRVREKIEESAWYSPTTGMGGALFSKIPGTNAYDVGALLRTIGGNIGFDRLQQMRDASPTGGALGAINQQELNLLMSVMGSLEQSQSEDQLLQNLDRLDQVYRGIMEKAQAYPNAAEFGFDSVPETQSAPMTDEEAMRILGIGN